MATETSTKAATASYVELAGHTFNLYVEAYAAANKRGLEYFDRVVSLTVTELSASSRQAAALSEALAASAAQLQESYTASLRGFLHAGLENLTYVKDTASATFGTLTVPSNN